MKKKYQKKELATVRKTKPEEIVTIENSQTHGPKEYKKSSVYFTKETEDAIIEYNATEDPELRDKIYMEKIKFPVEKLVENIFNTFKFSYHDNGPEQLMKETVAHVVANLPKFDPTKGSKAFSYFSIVVKNQLIGVNNGFYKKFQREQSINEMDHDNEPVIQLQAPEVNTDADEFCDVLVKFWDANLPRVFSKKRDFEIASAVVEILRNREKLEVFNKKALFIYIREIASCKTTQIAKVIDIMMKHQERIKKQWINKENIAYDRNSSERTMVASMSEV